VGTRLVNTRVQVLIGSTALYESAAKWCPKVDAASGCLVVDDRAVAQFTLAQGIYFVRLQRGGYPDHVYLLNLTRDTEVPYVMFQAKSTHTLYGQVTADPDYWAGRKISLTDAQDTVVRSVTVTPGGYFLVDSVWPDTPYRLRLDDGTQRIVSPVFTASDTGSSYMEVGAGTTRTDNTTLAPKLSASSEVALHAILSVQLKSGERPMVGETVMASTPRGTLNLSTDEKGQAYVQAAEAGDYTFTWQTQAVKMSVPKPAAPAPPAQNNTAENETPAAPAAPEAGAETAGASGQTSMLGLGTAFLLLIAAVVVIAVVFIFFVVPRLMRIMNSGAAKKEEPAAPMWPAMPELPAALGGEEHAHKGHARPAHHKRHEAHKRHKKKR
jgi:hypothetical protein